MGFAGPKSRLHQREIRVAAFLLDTTMITLEASANRFSMEDALKEETASFPERSAKTRASVCLIELASETL